MTSMNIEDYVDQFQTAREEDSAEWIDELRAQLLNENPDVIIDVCAPLFDADVSFWHRRLGWILTGAALRLAPPRLPARAF